MKLYDIDWNALKKGTIPWHVDDCIEVMEWYGKLHTTPKDDWDLRERCFSLKNEETEEMRQFQLNQFIPENQLGLYMAHRYEKLMPYHMYRLMKIFDFLRDYNEDLKIDELVKISDESHEDICTFLLQALCELPFTKKTKNADEESFDFDYQKVVGRARELIEEE